MRNFLPTPAGFSPVRACKGLPPEQPSSDPRQRDRLCMDCRHCAGVHAPRNAAPMERRVRLLAGVLLTCIDRVEVHGGTVSRIQGVGHPYSLGVQPRNGYGVQP